MSKISVNNFKAQILQTFENIEIDKEHKKIFYDHLNTIPKTYTKIKGIICCSAPSLTLDVKFFNAKKSAQIFFALIDELGEYFSIDSIEKYKGKIEFSVKISDKIKNKKITILVSKQLKDNSVSNAKIYEFKITDYFPLSSSYSERQSRG